MVVPLRRVVTRPASRRTLRCAEIVGWETSKNSVKSHAQIPGSAASRSRIPHRTGDAHAIKLTEACLRLHAERPEPVLLHAAARASELLG
jgi:hypothetical protein